MSRKRRIITIMLLTLASVWLFIAIAVSFGLPSALSLADDKLSKVAYVRCENLEEQPGVTVLDPNNKYFQVLRTDPNTLTVTWRETNLYLPDICTVPRITGQNLRVQGKLKNDKQYPVVIDTGMACAYAAVTDTVVLENDIEIYPVQGLYSSAGGFCHLCQLKIGDMTIVHPLSHYLLGHYEERFLGLRRRQQSEIYAGLPLLKNFKYILIDNPAESVTFSAKSIFRPEDPNSWHKFTMFIETDDKKNEFLMTRIPIAGQELEVLLDTGTGPALVVGKGQLAQLGLHQNVKCERQDRLTRLRGFEVCRFVILSDLQIAAISLESTEVAIREGQEEQMVLGMACFKDKSFVLDFAQGLLWVREPDLIVSKTQ